MTLRITIGIDPGQTGAIALLADGDFAGFIDMPTLPRAAGGLQVDAATLAASLRGVFGTHPGAYVFAALEQVGAMPKQGVTSTFRFGESFGVVLGALGALGHPAPAGAARAVEALPAAAWARKDVARTVAIQRHPGAAPHLQRKKDVGRADALLIATWAEITEQSARAA